jgi:hypothetical protein
MGGLVGATVRALATVAMVLAVSVAACGDITLAPDAGATTSGPGPAAPAAPAGPMAGAAGHAGPVAPGGTACAAHGDCQSGKLKYCDAARGVCVACLTDADCDGDRKCAAGTCGPKD